MGKQEIYQKLEPAKAEIRLLSLLPGKKDKPIRCSLQVASLDAHPVFEALSYMWGDESTTKPITVEDTSLDVTQNLHAALLQLRHVRKPRLLWVDAICINQADVSEKSSQIPLMSRIFSEAASVIAWLGPGSENVRLAASWVRRYRDKKRFSRASAHWLKLDIMSLFSSSAERRRIVDTAKALQGCFDIAANPYWTRMWTFQEFMLPAREPVCVLGETTFSATDLLHQNDDGYFGSVSLISDAQDVYIDKYMSSDGPSLDQTPGWAEQSALLERGFASYPENQEPELSTRLRSMIGGGEPSHVPLSAFILLTKERVCRDPRDKIYALYGLVPEAQRAWPPDYAKSIDRILLETNAYCVNAEKAHGLLADFPLYISTPESGTIGPYPSWVVDFTGGADGPHQLQGNISIAKRLRQADAGNVSIVTSDLGCLHLWAKRIGECEAVLKLGPDPRRVLSDLSALLSNWRSSCLFGRSSRRLQGGDEGFPGRVLKFLLKCSGTSNVGDIDSGRLLRAVKYYLEERWELEADQHQMPKSRRRAALMQALPRLVGKTLFVTNTTAVPSGTVFWGIGDGDIHAGDVVVVAPDTNAAAVVLTKRGLTSTEGNPSNCRMVGLVYVDGIMDEDDPVQKVIDCIEACVWEEFLVY